MRHEYKICWTWDDIYTLVDYIRQTGVVSHDFETTTDDKFDKNGGLKYYSPFSYPTVIGLSFQPGSAWIVPLGHIESPFKEEIDLVIKYLGKEIFSNPEITKVAWNTKFEYKWFLKYGVTMIGRCFDGMLAKHLLDEERPHGLKEMVAKFLPQFAGYGRKDFGTMTLEELSEYCSLDADLTLRLFIFFNGRLMKLGFYPLFRNLFTPLTSVLGKCEYYGIPVDREYLEGLVKKYDGKIKEADDKLRAIPRVRKYNRKLLASKKEDLLESIQREITILERSGKAHLIGPREKKMADIAMGIYNTKKERELMSPINFGSPKQLIDLLYNSEYGLELPITERTDKGEPSTSEETITKLKDQDEHGFIDGLLELRGLEKLQSTYIRGILNILDNTNIVHSNYKIHGTVTGRLSSTEPNMQNVPRVTTNPDVKKMFRAPKGYSIVELDYSQAELRIVAELAKEEQMITWFREGHNIHVAVAVKAEEVNTGKQLSYKDIYAITKDESHPDHVYWTKRKKRAKTINFGILYGQGPPKLAETLKCSKEEASQFLKEWLRTFPKIKRWINGQHKFVEENGYVLNMWGMKRRLPAIYSPKNWERSEAQRQAVNCVDSKTEALTVRGWETWDNLSVGDIILTKNPTTGILEWQPIEALSIFPDYKGEAYLIENRTKTFSALTTPEHRWLCNPSSKRLEKNRVYLSKDLYLDPPRCIHRTGTYQFPSESPYSDNLVSFLGWVLTDGNLKYYNLPGKPRNGKPHRVTITQSYRTNPKKVKVIQTLIKDLGFKVRELDIKETGSYRWVFTKEVADLLHSIIPQKVLNMPLLLSLTRVQATLLVNAMMLGDGSGGRRLCSGDLLNSGLFQILIILTGKCSNIVERNQIGKRHYGNVRNKEGYIESKNTSYKVSILERDKAHTKSTRGHSYVKQIHDYKGLMWCPTVQNSFWVCRRETTTYITGNTPIQGAASFFTLFSAIILEEMRIQGTIPLDRPMIYTVHDSLGYLVKNEHIHEFTKIAVPICANPQTQEYFGFQMKRVPMKASVELGPTWGEFHDYDKNKDYTL